MNITKSMLDKLLVPMKLKAGRTEQKRYYDEKLKGFGIRVTSGGTKAFFVEKAVNGSLKRSTIGHYPEITTEQARKMAQSALGKMVTGINPIAEKRAQRLKAKTLKEAFEDYVKARKSLKPSTVLDYRRVLNQVVPTWMSKQLTSITKEMIVHRHTEHGGSKSKARANLAMRLLRAIFNYAINEYHVDDGVAPLHVNPVKFLSHARSWYKIERRQTVIKNHQLADWYAGLQKLSEQYPIDQAEMWQDYFLLVLFSGLRRSEATSIRWLTVDLKAKTFTLEDTKNRSSFTLPMTDFLYELFLRRRKATRRKFVFPAESDNGHIMEPRKAMLKIASLSGVSFTIHDLRRTFITTAESLDISAYALKRLLNHKMNHDVTSGYLIIDVERLRKPMQQVTDYLLKCMRVKDTPVYSLESDMQNANYV